MTNRMNNNESELITERQQAWRELLGSVYDKPFKEMNSERVVSQEGVTAMADDKYDIDRGAIMITMY